MLYNQIHIYFVHCSPKTTIKYLIFFLKKSKGKKCVNLLPLGIEIILNVVNEILNIIDSCCSDQPFIYHVNIIRNFLRVREFFMCFYIGTLCVAIRLLFMRGKSNFERVTLVQICELQIFIYIFYLLCPGHCHSHNIVNFTVLLLIIFGTVHATPNIIFSLSLFASSILGIFIEIVLKPEFSSSITNGKKIRN